MIQSMPRALLSVNLTTALLLSLMFRGAESANKKLSEKPNSTSCTDDAQSDAEKEFYSMDADQNGYLDIKEVESTTGGVELHRASDKNGDGKLSLVEYEAAIQMVTNAGVDMVDSQDDEDARVQQDWIEMNEEQRRMDSTKSELYREDMSTEGLLEVLDVNVDSEFWTATADAVAQFLLKQRKQDAAESTPGSDTVSESAIEQTANATVDLQLSAEQMSELKFEHKLVRGAVSKALGLPAFSPPKASDEKFWRTKQALACAKSVSGVPEQPADDDQEEQKEALSRSVLAEDEEKKSTMERVLVDAWYRVKRDFKDLTSFFHSFLRWEIALAIWGSVDMMGMPELAWKCQPLTTCIGQIVKMPKKFLKFLATIISAIGGIMLELVKSVGRYLGISGKAKDRAKKEEEKRLEAQKQSQAQNGELGLDINLDSEPGQPPDQASIDKYVKGIHTTIFNEEMIHSAKCTNCGGRLKGKFAISLWNLFLTVFTGGLLGVVKMAIGTIPRPMTQYGIFPCVSCIYYFSSVLYGMLFGFTRSATKRYFDAGNCNAHNVGLCVLLEKVQTCGLTIHNRDRSQVTNDPECPYSLSKCSGIAYQKQFCDAFDGVTLRLTKVGGRIQCPDQYQYNELMQYHRVVELDEDSINTMDFKLGCHRVKDVLKRYNQMCERDAGDIYSKGHKKSRIERFKHMMARMGSKFEYKNAVVYSSLDDVARKCRALFNCPEKESDKSMARVDWSELQGAITNIVSKVDDYQAEPRSYSPIQASIEIVRLLEQSSQELQNFETRIAASVTATSGRADKWKRNLENIFLSEKWTDRCFQGLEKARRVAPLFKRLGNPDWQMKRQNCNRDSREKFCCAVFHDKHGGQTCKNRADAKPCPADVASCSRTAVNSLTNNQGRRCYCKSTHCYNKDIGKCLPASVHLAMEGQKETSQSKKYGATADEFDFFNELANVLNFRRWRGTGRARMCTPNFGEYEELGNITGMKHAGGLSKDKAPVVPGAKIKVLAENLAQDRWNFTWEEGSLKISSLGIPSAFVHLVLVPPIKQPLKKGNKVQLKGTEPSSGIRTAYGIGNVNDVSQDGKVNVTFWGAEGSRHMKVTKDRLVEVEKEFFAVGDFVTWVNESEALPQHAIGEVIEGPLSNNAYKVRFVRAGKSRRGQERLIQDDYYFMRDQLHHHDGPSLWYLTQCVGKLCAGATPGSLVHRISVKAVSGPDVNDFMRNVKSMMEQVITMDKMLLSTGGGEDNPGLPKSGLVEAQQVLDWFKAWEARFFKHGHEELVKRWTVEGHSSLWSLVSDSDVLVKLFDKKDWVFHKRELQANTLLLNVAPGRVCFVKENLDGESLSQNREGPQLYEDEMGTKPIRPLKAGEKLVVRHTQEQTVRNRRTTPVEPKGWVPTKWLEFENYVWDLHIKGKPMRFARQLNVMLRDLGRPNLDAQRTLWEGLRQFAESFFVDAPTEVLYDIERDRSMPVPINPFNSLMQKSGIVVVQIDFVSPDLQTQTKRDPALNAALREAIFRRFEDALKAECRFYNEHDGQLYSTVSNQSHQSRVCSTDRNKKYLNAAMTEHRVKEAFKTVET